jgi:subtilase family serine protease
MEQYGINNVRGGAYSCMELDSDQECNLVSEIISANDLCARCGRSGHFIKSCYAKLDVNGEKIESESSESGDSDSSSSSDNESDDYTCYRCGRNGHLSTSCYASKHVKGYMLK